MKLIVNQKNLKRALLVVEKAIGRNISLPILSNILIKTENGRLKLSATNLEVGINYFIGVKIEETGEIAIPARVLSDFISNIQDDKISLSTKNNILYINTDNYKTQILGTDPKDFPIIPKIKDSAVFTAKPLDLQEALMSVYDSTALSEGRPELTGIFASISGSEGIFASTDGFRLAERVIPVKGIKNHSFIIPKGASAEMIRILGDIEGDISVQVGDNQIAFQGEEFELVSRIIDGNYPDYKKIIPDKYLSSLTVKREDLEKNIKIASVFASNIADIKIHTESDSLIITSRNSEKGEVETKVGASLKGDPFDISINYHYILDGIKAIDDSKISINYTGQSSPLVLKPSTDGNKSTYVIMPLRGQ